MFERHEAKNEHGVTPSLMTRNQVNVTGQHSIAKRREYWVV